jgi:hypothetical protein
MPGYDLDHSVQPTIDSLGGKGGTVIVPCGTFAGPTAIPSFTRVVSSCTARPSSAALIGNGKGITGNWAHKAYAPVNASQTIFKYARSVTLISKAFGAEISGIVFDFGGTNSGLTIEASVGGLFDFAVENCAGRTSAVPCLTLKSVDKSENDYFAAAENEFRRIMINAVPFGSVAGGIGIKIIGGGADQRANITNNLFGFVSIYGVETGIQFAGWDDSNHFQHVYINVNPGAAGSGNAIAANCGSSIDEGDNGITIDYLETDYNGMPTTGHAICLGHLRGFRVGTFEPGHGWRSNILATTGRPSYAIRYGWDVAGNGAKDGFLLQSRRLQVRRDGPGQ